MNSTFSLDESTGNLNITSPKWVWGIQNNNRDYVVTTLPFEVANKYFDSIPFNAESGNGEQRTSVESHVKKLKKEIMNGRYTPTAFGANLTKKHLNGVTESDCGNISISVSEKYPLRQTDGAHRFQALRAILVEAKELHDEGLTEAINGLPITTLIYLGEVDAQQDFINLQSGKTVDSNMLTVLKIQKNQYPEKLIELLNNSLEVCHALNELENSPWETFIKFDTIGVATLKFTSLASKGGGDGASSTVGMMRVLRAGAAAASPFCDGDLPTIAAATIVTCANYLIANRSKACQSGYLLCPPPSGGAGSSTLLIGVATALAYKMVTSGKSEIGQDDLHAVKVAVEASLGMPILGDLSASRKRTLMKGFTQKMFADAEEMCKDGVPDGLLEILGPGSFGMSKDY